MPHRARNPLPRLLPLLLMLSACGPSRVLRLENSVLQARNDQLERDLLAWEARSPDPADFSTEVDLDLLDRWLTRAGQPHRRVDGPSPHLVVTFQGDHADFDVIIRHFPKARVVFLSTDGWMSLQDTAGNEAVVLLLVQIAALNYDLLVGKAQMNPETGEILLSIELEVEDGLGYATFTRALRDLCQLADDHTDDLRRSAEGLGL